MNTAKIIGITVPVGQEFKITTGRGKYGRADETRRMSAEEFIAYTARVSNPGNQHNTLTTTKLLQYLITHKHWSPFEMVDVVMEIETTRDIAHQIIRHRSFSFQEFSQRYADPTKDMGFVTREARLQDAKNRQNSIEITEDEKWNYYKDFSPMTKQEAWEKMQSEVADTSKYMYEEAIRMGIAKEQARAVLPEGLTKTRLYMKGSLRSWIHYIDVRAEEGTQKEHREIAIAAQGQILTQFPSLEEYWFPTPEPVVENKPWWRFW